MYKHKTVLLEEAVDSLEIKPDGIYVDATTGGGGHSSLILSKLKKEGHLYCFDQDEYAFTKAKTRLDEISNNYTFIHSNFVNLKQELLKYDIKKIDGIIYDLGVSSFQLDIQERGFSYRLDAPLDMRMNQEQELSAYH
ncbi:MAG: 16S rRNA (cytosine(1402)-N(4))-methyltransferase RsmH, partial [Anaeroplasmataceae bacterium]|nr:16S rRNA (cytosine(1402)-N(4))-methyltransferase RsmH [Anaeroplasmataceae bacterium]